MAERKSRYDRFGERAHKTGLWVLGMLYVFGFMAVIVTLLSVTGIIDPSERQGQILRDGIQLVPDDPNSCHPSYDKCLDPDAADYDCKGGGVDDGPRFIEGPVIVDGPDPFELDGDGNGIGCEEG